MRLFRVALAWLFFCAPVFAQVGQIPGWPPRQPVIASSYTGPGDLATFMDWWGFRCYSNAYSGNVADITDTATGTTTGTRLQCSGGVVSSLVSGSACTFVTGNVCSPLATTCATSCNVLTLYTQTGATNCTGSVACNVTQAANARRPVLTVSCQNSHPCLTTSGAGSTFLLSSPTRGIAAQAQPYSASMVFKSPATGDAFLMQAVATGPDLLYRNTTVVAAISAGTEVSVSAASNAIHAIQAVYSGAACVIYLDSARTSSLNCSTGSISTGIQYTIGTNNAGAGNTLFMEGGWTLSGGSFSNTVQSNIDLNQRAYWGF